jgi:ferritin-like metal-binding protein YciE
MPSEEEETMTALDRQLVTALRDAHALEQHVQAVLSEALTSVADEPELCRPLGHFAERAHAHNRAIEARLRAHDASPSLVKDAGMLFASVAEAAFGPGHRAGAAKYLRDAYAAVHLQIAAGELLWRLAERNGDPETARVAAGMCSDGHEIADQLSGTWDLALDVALRAHAFGGRRRAGSKR